MNQLKKHMLAEGKTSSIVTKECHKICQYIKQVKPMDIVNVSPGYKLVDINELVFVVFAKTEIVMDLPWEFVIKVLGQVSEESQTLTYHENKYPLTKKTEKGISSVIDQHADKLIKTHTFLSAISASSVMFQNKETGKQEIVQSPCIVLYVIVKSVVFLTEKPFPDELGGFPVDVREGIFRTCGPSAGDFHDNIRMGCKITSNLHPDKYGTLGGFIEHPEYGLCGFTCAHIFRNQDEMYSLKRANALKEDDLQLGYVFQPETGDNKRIGRVVKLVYKEGSAGETGVDAALIKIEKRAPIAGNFPDDKGVATGNKNHFQ